MSANPFESYEDPFSDPFDGHNRTNQGMSNGNNNDNNNSHSQFINEYSRILEDIDNYKEAVKYLNQLEQRQIHSVSENEKENLIQQIDSQSLEIKSSQIRIKDSIESLKLKVDRSNPDMITQINNLNRNFRNAIKDLMVYETNFKEDLTNQAVEQYQIVNPESNYDEARGFVENFGSQQVFQNSLEMQNRKADAMEAFHNVENRFNEMQKIEEMAAMLNELTSNLQDLVVEQDVYFDSANQQIDTAQSELEKGDANVVSATQTAKKNRKCKWIILGLCFLLACIIAGVIAGLVKGLSGH